MALQNPAAEAHEDSPDSGPDLEALAQRLRPLGNASRLLLIDMLSQPLYVEEIAAKLNMSRPGARKHLDALVDIGVLRKRVGRRDSGPVVEYMLDRAGLFQIQVQFAEVGARKNPPADNQTTRTLLAEIPSRNNGGSAGIPQPSLTVVRGIDEGRIYCLGNTSNKVWRLGRGPETDIQLDYDPFVSTRHAEIVVQEQGLVLTDLYSKNGTYVNWRRMRPGVEVPLARGDIVGVGKTRFVLQVQAPA